MARMIVSKKKQMLPLLEFFRCLMNVISLLQILLYLLIGKHYKDYVLKSDSYFTHEARQLNLHNIIFHKDTMYVNQLRINRYAFAKLCDMLCAIGKLRDTKHVTVEEMTVLFLHILAHHNCLGALDGTYIWVNVLEADKPRYRTRKNDITTNVLGVCSQDMQFTFVLLSWEGSVADSRVLRDAVSRKHGLKVPCGFYYLVDAGYPNGEGFLTPYRGQRHHLNDWRIGH
ncbi:hypothetical protein L1049_027209 [Liquidambar formosana]|uniref:DDE Tnp4 domain-containing protein n=1 Tax=Liquidambar formosana TaxID=63359 RepID=A0AAP0N5H7_LIQFO